MQMFDTFKKMNLLEFIESSKCDDQTSIVREFLMIDVMLLGFR